MKFTYQVNYNEQEIIVKANNGSEALDLAAKKFGYIDYADMAQELNWGEDEGLDIVENGVVYE